MTGSDVVKEPLYVRVMDLLYAACMVIAGVAIAVMAVIIGWSVYTRYVLTEGSFWAEPIAIALAVQMTFYGAAACYRANAHISIDLAVRGLRGQASIFAARLVDILMLAISLAMIWYGLGLVKTTFFQVYPEFQHIRVGVVYTALP
ncbi:MAG: TRAP transporter small permease, partial [Geminicoccaceae bacterium]